MTGAWTSAEAATLAIGYRVVTTTTLTPRDTPDGPESPLGSQRIGMLGTILDGPIAAGGFQWWNLDFETGADGWVTEESIAQPYFPPPDTQGGWRALVGLNQTPTSAQKSVILATTGVDWDKLKLASNYSASFGSGSVVLVIRNGYVVGNWGNKLVHRVASVSKSLTGMAWAKLFDQSAAGELGATVDLASPAHIFLPSSWGDSDVRRKDILIEHLMTMSSGLEPDDNPNPMTGYLNILLSKPVRVPPATEWSYVSIPVDLSSVAHTSITGQKLGDYLNQSVAQPIGVTSLGWVADFDGYTRASSRARMTIPDLARMGYLMLMNGAWQSGSEQTQIISVSNAAMLRTTPAFLPDMTFVPTPNSPFAINPDSQMYYGHLWWTNSTGAALGPAVPRDAYFGRGFTEVFLVVVPSENLVVVRYGDFPKTLAQFGREFMARVLAALLPQPLAYWKLDEGSGTVIGDSSGNNFTGTAKNGTAWTMGMSGSALLFDGVNDFADFATPPVFANLSSFTVAGWVNPDALKTKTFNTIAAKSSGSGGTAQKRMLINNSTACQSALGCLEFSVNRTSAGARALSPPGTVTAGTWQHVVFTYSPSDGPRIYKDGVEVTYLTRTVGSGAAVNDAAGNFLLGSWGTLSSPSGLFKGRLDDVRLYNARLSASAVAALHQSVTGGEIAGASHSISFSVDSGGGLPTMKALLNPTVPMLAGSLITSTAAADSVNSIRVFDATPTSETADGTFLTARTADATSLDSALTFVTQRICLDLSAEDTVLLSSTRDGTGGVVIDNFLAVNGRNVCEGATGQSTPESCFGPQLDSLRVDQDIRNIWAEIPPLDLTRFLLKGIHKYTFEMKNLDGIAGNTDLFLNIIGTGRFCSVLPEGPNLDVELRCTGPGELSAFVRNRGNEPSRGTRVQLTLERVLGGDSQVIARSTPRIPPIPPNSDLVLLDTIQVGECPDPPLNDDRCDFFAHVDDTRTTAECRKQGKMGAVCESDESDNTEGGTIGGLCGGF